MNLRIRILRPLLSQLLSHARFHFPLESCGLLAGPPPAPNDPPLITTFFPAPNALASPTAYEIAPADLFYLFRKIRDAGLLHLGIYHSHPTTDAFPSPSDIALSFYPDAAYFIVSLLPAVSPAIRAFRIDASRVSEIQILTV